MWPRTLRSVGRQIRVADAISPAVSGSVPAEAGTEPMAVSQGPTWAGQGIFLGHRSGIPVPHFVSPLETDPPSSVSIQPDKRILGMILQPDP